MQQVARNGLGEGADLTRRQSHGRPEHAGAIAIDFFQPVIAAAIVAARKARQRSPRSDRRPRMAVHFVAHSMIDHPSPLQEFSSRFAKKLHRYPVNGRPRSLREVSKALAEAGYLSTARTPYTAVLGKGQPSANSQPKRRSNAP